MLLLFLEEFSKILLRHNSIRAYGHKARAFFICEKCVLRLCVLCVKVWLRVVSQQWELRVFRAQLRLRTFLFPVLSRLILCRTGRCIYWSMRPGHIVITMGCSGMRNLYVVGLFKSIFQRKNFCAVLYLMLNIGVINSIFLTVFGTSAESLLAANIIYLFAVVISLSPVGESFLRTKEGCKRITDVTTLNRLEPLFMEVKERAFAKYPEFHIHPKIRLYIKEDPEPNAFAVGRRTICVTTGLLQYSDDEIKAILGHEFGHLSTHDTDLVLLITCGNFIVSAIVTIFKVFIFIFKGFCAIVGFFTGEEGRFLGIVTSICSLLTTFFVDGLMWVWTKVGIWLVMKTSRDAEHEADAFSCDLGYMDGILSFFNGLIALERDYGETESKSIFAALSSSHPATEKRINEILKRVGNIEV